MIRDDLRPIIEGVYMRGSASRVKEDDAIGFRGMVTVSCCQRIVGSRLKVGAQASQCNGSKPTRCTAQKLTTCFCLIHDLQTKVNSGLIDIQKRIARYENSRQSGPCRDVLLTC